MRIKTFTATAAVLTLLAASPVVLAQTTDTQPAPPAATQSAPGGAAMAADKMMGDLTGLDVWSSDNQKLGEVADVRKGAGGDVEAIHMKAGGFLGIGQRTVEIKAGQFSKEGKNIKLSLTADQVKALPAIANGAADPGK